MFDCRSTDLLLSAECCVFGLEWYENAVNKIYFAHLHSRSGFVALFFIYKIKDSLIMIQSITIESLKNLPFGPRHLPHREKCEEQNHKITFQV